jgi:hypothetical protein
MTRLLLPLYGLAIGAAIGWLLGRLPLGGLVQSVSAALIAWVLSSIAVAIIWTRSAMQEAGISAVSINLSGAVIALAVVGISSALLHLMLGWLAQSVHPSIGGSRPVVLGSVAGLVCGIVFGVAAGRIDTLT